jgi:hypothetical protein
MTTKLLRTALIFLTLALCMAVGRAYAGVNDLAGFHLTTYPCSGLTCTAPTSLAANTYLLIPAGGTSVGMTIDVGIVCGSLTAVHRLLGYDGSQWWPVGDDITTDASLLGGRSGTRLSPGTGYTAYALLRTSGSCVPTKVRITTGVRR